MTVGKMKEFLKTKEDCRTIQILICGAYRDFTMTDVALGMEHLDNKGTSEESLLGFDLFEEKDE